VEAARIEDGVAIGEGLEVGLDFGRREREALVRFAEGTGEDHAQRLAGGVDERAAGVARFDVAPDDEDVAIGLGLPEDVLPACRDLAIDDGWDDAFRAASRVADGGAGGTARAG
jgi:hypothetical protein